MQMGFFDLSHMSQKQATAISLQDLELTGGGFRRVPKHSENKWVFKVHMGKFYKVYKDEYCYYCTDYYIFSDSI